MEKQLVVITGASAGIGGALGQIFSAAGYPLALIARNVEAMQNLQLPNVVCQRVDVTDYDAFREAIGIAVSQFGPVDCLINNAGVGVGGEFTQIQHDEHEKMVKVNLLGVINGMEIVLPGMRQRKSGTIINISSIADRVARPQLATYAATKAAVKSLSESLRVANAKYGIRICNVAPAKILTPMLVAAQLNQGQTIPPEEFAKAVLWVYQQPKSICVRDMVFTPTEYEA